MPVNDNQFDPMAAAGVTPPQQDDQQDQVPMRPVAVPVAPVAAQPAAVAQPAAQPDQMNDRWKTALNERPGSFSSRLSDALQVASNTPEGRASMNTIGGFFRNMIAASVDAMATNPNPPLSNAAQVRRGAAGVLSDIAAGTGGRTGLEGIGRAAAAVAGRQQAEQKEQLDQQLAVNRDKREQMQFALNVAQSNAQMLHSQFLLHHAMTEEINENIAEGNKAVDFLKNQPKPGEVIGTDLTSDDIQRGLQQHSLDPTKGFDPTTMTPYLTGKIQVGTAEDGTPQYRGTYTLVKLPKTVQITDPEEVKKLFPELVGDKEVSATDPITVSTAAYNARYQANETALAIKAKTQAAANQAAIDLKMQADQIEAQKFYGAEIWAHNLATVAKAHPEWSHAEQVVGAYHLLQLQPPKDAKGNLLYPNLEADIAARLGEKNFNQIQQAAEQARHNRAEEAIQNKRADAMAQKEQTDKAAAASYNFQTKRLDTWRKPLDAQMANLDELQTALAIGNAAADSVVAPVAMKALVGGAGSGIRITKAEIDSVLHGRSTVEDMKAIAQKAIDGKAITPEQRKQLQGLAKLVGDKVARKSALFNKAEEEMASPDSTPENHKQSMLDLRRGLQSIDGEAFNNLDEQDKSAVRSAIKATLPPAAPGTVNFQDSKGGFHNIPLASLPAAKQRDPNLQVIQ
jgi:hypothetical protein